MSGRGDDMSARTHACNPAFCAECRIADLTAELARWRARAQRAENDADRLARIVGWQGGFADALADHAEAVARRGTA